MTSTFLTLEIGKSTLQASMMGVQTTGHNIANASTDGYSREVVDSQTANSLVTYTDHRNFLGQGVIARGQNRVVDEYVSQQYRENNADQTYWGNQDTEINHLASVFNEPSGTTLRNGIDAFFSSWNKLGTAPQDVGARSTLIEAAQNVVDAFHTTQSTLATNQTRYGNQLIDSAKEVNAIATGIAELNTQIEKAQQQGSAPNDLLDQRDALLDKLSSYVGIDVKYSVPNPAQPNVTSMTVTLKASPGNAPVTLVQDGTTPGLFTNLPTDPTDQPKFGNLQAAVTTLQDKSGSMTSFNDMYNYTQTRMNSLDNLANTLEADVNTQQASGDDQNGNPGVNMFAGAGATGISLAFTNPALLAAASAGGGSTDGSNAQAMAANFNGVIDGQYAQILTTLGDDGQAASLQNNTFSSLTTQVTTLRQSVSGVNINEEMSNMIQYQQTYGAASQLIKTFSGMLDTLINEVH